MDKNNQLPQKQSAEDMLKRVLAVADLLSKSLFPKPKILKPHYLQKRRQKHRIQKLVYRLDRNTTLKKVRIIYGTAQQQK
jgi:hypothetical protein